MESQDSAARAREAIDAIYRADSRRVLATLIRLLGDFDLAEEALHDAFAAAMAQWPGEGIPANPCAWLVSTGRFKAIDRLRRWARFNAPLAEDAQRIEDEAATPADEESIQDDQLRLIFTCCHPALGSDAQVVLTLREVCGLTTEEIAQAFLMAAPAVAQRIVRAKAKIREARIPYRVPSRRELPERLDGVLRVIYLIFNEGYFATTGGSLVRADFSAEAIRLGRLLADLLPDPEAIALLALMLLHESRRAARMSPEGGLIRLEDQDCARWDASLITEGSALVARSLSFRRVGPYGLQAAIAALHAEAPEPGKADWPQVVALYDLLLRVDPSPVVELNRAVAIAMRDGPEAGLREMDARGLQKELDSYHFFHGARADLLHRLGRPVEAAEAYQAALALTKQEPERRHLERRLRELDLPG